MQPTLELTILLLLPQMESLLQQRRVLLLQSTREIQTQLIQVAVQLVVLAMTRLIQEVEMQPSMEEATMTQLFSLPQDPKQPLSPSKVLQKFTLEIPLLLRIMLAIDIH